MVAGWPIQVMGRVACAVLALTAVLPARAAPVEELTGYRLSDYRAPTPAGLTGAVTLDADGVRALLARGEALPLFVQRLDRSPTLPGAPWLLSKPYRQIPGSVWLPNVGLGAPDPATLAWFQQHLDRLSGGDRARGLLFYCLSDCWLSWNAAKRALSLGHTRVYWFPAGIDGWLEAGLPSEEATPLPGP